MRIARRVNPISVRNFFVRIANRYLEKRSPTDWDRNGEMRFVKEDLDGRSGHPVVIDVGANTGNWARRVLELCPLSVVHSFEPLVDFYAQIEKSERHHTYCFGLGEKDFNTVGYRVGGGGSLLDVKKRPGKLNKELPVEVRQGDAFIESAGIDRVDYIKIDVDGTETDVIRGLIGTITRFRPTVQFEFGDFNYMHGDAIFPLLRLFGEHDYAVFILSGHGLHPIKRYKHLYTDLPINLNYVANPAESPMLPGAA